MSLIKRVSTVSCDWCGLHQELEHDIDLEADAGYPYNKAKDGAGWSEPFIKKQKQYIDLCPACTAKYRTEVGKYS